MELANVSPNTQYPLRRAEPTSSAEDLLVMLVTYKGVCIYRKNRNRFSRSLSNSVKHKQAADNTLIYNSRLVVDKLGINGLLVTASNHCTTYFASSTIRSPEGLRGFGQTIAILYSFS